MNIVVHCITDQRSFFAALGACGSDTFEIPHSLFVKVLPDSLHKLKELGFEIRRRDGEAPVKGFAYYKGIYICILNEDNKQPMHFMLGGPV